MNHQQPFRLLPRGQVTQDIPSPVALGLVRFVLENLSCPVSGALRPDVEIGRFVEHSLVMISAEADFAAVNDSIKTLTGTCSISDHVAQAENALDRTTVDIRQRGCQRFKIPMNV